MTDLINIQMNKDNKYSGILTNKKSLEQILSQKKNIKEVLKKSQNKNNSNNLNINKNNRIEENKKIIKRKNNTAEIIHIIFYGLLGYIILLHLFHFIFSKKVSNKYNIFLVFNLLLSAFYICFIWIILFNLLFSCEKL